MHTLIAVLHKWMEILLLRAYTTYVRPLLEYCTVVWSPSLKCDIHSIEKVQRNFTKRLSGCNSLTYTERRNKLNLTTLELRRLYYDLVMCYTRAQLLPRMADRLCLHRRCVEYLATGNFYLLA